jgi:predicted ATP-binding protein involved in virulence
MKLKRLELQNFRCFAGLTIDFDPRLTILVGENGSGKTSILDALAVFLKSIAGFWGRRSLSLPQLKNTDMGFGESRQVNLRLTTLGPAAASPMLGGSFIKGKMGQDDLQIDEPDRREYEKVIESICKAYPDVHNKKTFPVLVYYSSKRTLPDDAALQSSRGESAVTAAFQNAFSPTIDFKNSLAWFADKDADEARMVRDENPDYKMPELEAVRQAVIAALGDCDSPRVRRSELIVFKKSAKDAYTLTRLGDGHRTMLALVMDLARRMAVANQDVVWGENETVLHSPAVVLIDEIELHLHPSWQQTVLPSLMGIFPNAQFS